MDNLARTHEILRIGTELLHSWAKLTATHCFGYVKAEFTLATLRIVQTEFTDYHFKLNLSDKGG